MGLTQLPQAGLDGFPTRFRHQAEQLSGRECLAREVDQVGEFAELNGADNAAFRRATRKYDVRKLQILSGRTQGHPSNTAAVSPRQAL